MHINPEIITLSFPLFSLFLHFFYRFTLSPFFSSSLFHFIIPHSSSYILCIYICIYICIYNSESSHLILEEKARESKVTPASDISPSQRLPLRRKVKCICRHHYIKFNIAITNQCAQIALVTWLQNLDYFDCVHQTSPSTPKEDSRLIQFSAQLE